MLLDRSAAPCESHDGMNLCSQRDGAPDSEPLSRDPQSPCVGNRPMLVAGKPQLRQDRAVFVVGDQEVIQFSDDITVNCAPLV
jgi:hypothetical protein